MDMVMLKETLQRELPELLRADPGFREYLLELMRRDYPTRAETQDRFYEMLGELRREREERSREWREYQDKQDRKWDEQKAEDQRKWEEQKAEDQRKWDEQNRKWDEQNRKWDEQNRKWDEHNRKWDEQKAEDQRKWDEQNRKWQESGQRFDQTHQEIMALAERLERRVGALGSRWGIQSETSFRNALAGILERTFGVQVVNVNEFDDQGTVFGRPDQVELDVIVKNGLLLICELKSSIDKAGMYIFERKARFYEQRHQRKADRLIVVSPMIDARARKVAEKLGIEMFSDSSQVEEQP